ncbi:MAG: hypothetical protein COB42_06860 [Sulfurimonas sp.]|nr:MAG: hypothetical protein COB42_06860 [Sulfurimonas sp.]
MKNKILEIITPAINRCIDLSSESKTTEEKEKVISSLVKNSQNAEDNLVLAILSLIGEFSQNKRKVFLDIESNGWQGSSVLSIAAMKDDGQVFSRFYYPVEEYNKDATDFNGLTEEKVIKLRGDGCMYVSCFINDKDFHKFMGDVDTLICHNIAFDYSFLPNEITENIKNLFCTMKSNTKYFSGKFPNLKKTCEFYGVEVDTEQQHQALYDAILCKGVFERMKEEDINYTHDYLIPTKRKK